MRAKLACLDAILDDPDIRRLSLDEEESDELIDEGHSIEEEDFADLLRALATDRRPELRAEESG